MERRSNLFRCLVVSFYCFWIISHVKAAKPSNDVNSNALLGIRFLNYTVKYGSLASGECCDHPTNMTGACPPDLCDVAIRPCGTRNMSHPCDVFPSQPTPTTFNTNSIVFGNHIGNGEKQITRLVVLKIPYSKKNISLSLALIETSTNVSAEEIAVFNFTIYWVDPIFSLNPNFRHYFLKSDNAELSVDIVSMCNRYLYTEDCSVQCKSDRIHFSCLYNGTKECYTGWEGPDCLTMTDYCPGNLCQHGSTCVPIFRNYTCTCPPGFTGTFCEIILPTPTLPQTTSPSTSTQSPTYTSRQPTQTLTSTTATSTSTRPTTRTIRSTTSSTVPTTLTIHTTTSSTIPTTSTTSLIFTTPTTTTTRRTSTRLTTPTTDMPTTPTVLSVGPNSSPTIASTPAKPIVVVTFGSTQATSSESTTSPPNQSTKSKSTKMLRTSTKSDGDNTLALAGGAGGGFLLLLLCGLLLRRFYDRLFRKKVAPEKLDGAKSNGPTSDKVTPEQTKLNDVNSKEPTSGNGRSPDTAWPEDPGTAPNGTQHTNPPPVDTMFGRESSW